MKQINGFEGLYSVDECGNIYNSKMEIIKPQLTNSGYALVHLYRNNKRKAMTVHRLVAIAYLGNPNNLPQVNHKDGNKQNNNVNNLEWVSLSENMNHSFSAGLMENAKAKASARMKAISTDPVVREKIRQTLLKSHCRAKPIAQIGKDGEVVRVFHSGGQAQRETGFTNIHAVATGRQETAGGFYWKYVSTFEAEYDNEVNAVVVR